MNEGKDKTYLVCKCGCDRFWISVTDKHPKGGLCCNCRKGVELGAGMVSVASPDAPTIDFSEKR